MRAIPDSFDPGVVAEIDQRLAGVEASNGVRIPWAIESGSRAWGFPSPDSDYDCRFVYVRSEAAYLSPWPARDVIETPLDAIFDVNGWDLRKAVQLLVNGNAVLLEWLRSPYVYTGVPSFRDGLLELADEVVDVAAVGRHYAHVGARQWSRYSSGSEVQLKRLFYALRPAATVRWLETHPGSSVAPMELMPLLLQSEAPGAVIAAVEELVELKAATREMGVGAVPTVLHKYVAGTVEMAMDLFVSSGRPDAAVAQARASEWFIGAVRAFGPPSNG